jgi:hypothetical protein
VTDVLRALSDLVEGRFHTPEVVEDGEEQDTWGTPLDQDGGWQP